MANDPELVDDARAWFLKAFADLRAAEALLPMDPPLWDQAAFHCQQAAEKALKGFLTWHQTAFRKTHNLDEIGKQCVALDSSLSDLAGRAVPLSKFATAFRYPGALNEATQGEASEALSTARAIFDAVLSRLPREVGP